MNKEKKHISLKSMLVLLCFVLFVMSGCGGKKKAIPAEEQAEQIAFSQSPELPAPSGGFVLSVGGEVISSEEIIAPAVEHFRPLVQKISFEQFGAQVRVQLEQVVVTKISNILLYQEAKRQAGDKIDEALEKAVKGEVRRFVVSFGGDYAKAEQTLKEMGMDWASFEEYQKKMILSQSYMSTKLPDDRPITYSELLANYNKMKDEVFTKEGTIKFRLIDIQPAKVEVTDPNRTRRQLAKDLADELVEQIREGKDFGELAKRYSHGHRAGFGGLWKEVNPKSLAEPYDVLAVEAKKMEAGETAGPIETSGHIFIMKLEEKQEQSIEPFEEVQNQIKARIIFGRRKRAADKFSAELVQQAALGYKDEFVDYCLKEIYRRCNE